MNTGNDSYSAAPETSSLYGSTDRSSVIGGWEKTSDKPIKIGYGPKMRTLIILNIVREWASPVVLVFKAAIFPIILMSLLYFATIIDKSYSAVDTVIQPQPELATCRHMVERNCVDLTMITNIDLLEGFSDFIISHEGMADPVVEHLQTVEELATLVEESPHYLRKNIFGVSVVGDTLDVTVFSSTANDIYNSWNYFSPSCEHAVESGQACLWERNYPVIYEHLLSFLSDKYLELELEMDVDVSGYPADSSWFTVSYSGAMPFLLCAFIIGVPCIALATTIINISEDKESGRTLFLKIQGITEFMQFGVEYVIATIIVQLGIFIMVVMSIVMDFYIVNRVELFTFWFVNMLDGVYLVGVAMCFRPILKKKLHGLVLSVSFVLVPILIVQCIMPGIVSIYQENPFGSIVDILFNILPCVPIGAFYGSLMSAPWDASFNMTDVYKGSESYDPRSTIYLTFYALLTTLIAVIIHAFDDMKYAIKNHQLNKQKEKYLSKARSQEGLALEAHPDFVNPNLISLDNFVEFENVTFTYNKNKANCNKCCNKKPVEPIFKNINVNISTVTAIVGKSGAGKSTFFNLILGILKPTKGKIKVLGKPPELTRNYIGVVFQQSQLFPDLTVRQHVKLLGGLKVGKLSNTDVSAILHRVLLDDTCLNLRPKNMSGGMQRRLCVALAILGDIKFLLLDEPTTGLDPITQLEIWNMLHVLNKHIPIVFSTHMLSEISTLEADILFVGGKKVTGNGSLENILERGVRVDCREMSMIRIDNENILQKLESPRTFTSHMRSRSFAESDTVKRSSITLQESPTIGTFKVDVRSDSNSFDSAEIGPIEQVIQDVKTKATDGSTSMEDLEKIEIKEFDKGFLVFSRYFPINPDAVTVDDPDLNQHVNHPVIRQWSVEEAVTVFSGYENITDIADEENGQEDQASGLEENKGRSSKCCKKRRKTAPQSPSSPPKNMSDSERPATHGTATGTDPLSEYTISDPLIHIATNDPSGRVGVPHKSEVSNIVGNDRVEDIDDLDKRDDTESEKTDNIQMRDKNGKQMTKRSYNCRFYQLSIKYYLMTVAKAAARSPVLIVFMFITPALIIVAAVELMGLATAHRNYVSPSLLFNIPIDFLLAGVTGVNTGERGTRDIEDNLLKLVEYGDNPTPFGSDSLCLIGTENQELFDMFCPQDDILSKMIKEYLGVTIQCELYSDIHMFKEKLYTKYNAFFENIYENDNNNEEEEVPSRAPMRPIAGMYYSSYTYTPRESVTPTQEDTTNQKDKMQLKVDFIPQIFQEDADSKYALHTLWELQVMRTIVAKQISRVPDVPLLKTLETEAESIKNISLSLSVGNDMLMPTVDNMTMYCLWANLQLPVVALWTITRRSRYHLIERLSGGFSRKTKLRKAGFKVLPVIIDMAVLFVFSFIVSLVSMGFYAIGEVISLDENSLSALCLQCLSIAFYTSVVGTALSFFVKSIIGGVVIGLVVVLVMLAIGNTQPPYGEYHTTALGKVSLIFFPSVLLAMSTKLSLGGVHVGLRMTAPRIMTNDLFGLKYEGDNPNVQYYGRYTENAYAFLVFFGFLVLNTFVWLMCVVLRRVPKKIIEKLRFKKRSEEHMKAVPAQGKGMVEDVVDTSSGQTDTAGFLVQKTTDIVNESDTIVKSSELTKKFGRRTVLFSVNLSIKEGDKVAILGTTGSGKTTFLGCLTGKYGSYGGNIQYIRATPNKYNNKIMTTVGLTNITSLCEQEDILFDYLTVIEHVILSLRLQYSLALDSSSEIQQMAKRLLLSVGLTSKDYKKRPKELSGGMRRRLSIALALSAKREVAVLDEPTTGLDMATKLQVTQSLLEIHKHDPYQTFILTTHDMDVAERFANRIIILDRGHIRLDDEVEHIRETAPTLIKASTERRYKKLIEMLDKDSIAYDEMMFGASHCISTNVVLPQPFRKLVEEERGFLLMEPSIHTAFAKAVFMKPQTAEQD